MPPENETWRLMDFRPSSCSRSTLRVEIHGIAASIRRHSLESPEAAAPRAWLPVVNESNTTGEAAGRNA